MRRAVVDRVTSETSIALRLNLDGRGRYSVSTGIRFFDHMLELVARHGAFDLTVKATGDLDVDQHHTVEDVGIAFGDAVAAALGSRRGINRAGYFVMPMDETLAVAAIDLPGVRARQQRGEADGRLVGIGFSIFCEQAAHGTSVYAGWGIPMVPGHEQATARLTPDGSILKIEHVLAGGAE